VFQCVKKSHDSAHSLLTYLISISLSQYLTMIISLLYQNPKKLYQSTASHNQSTVRLFNLFMQVLSSSGENILVSIQMAQLLSRLTPTKPTKEVNIKPHYCQYSTWCVKSIILWLRYEWFDLVCCYNLQHNKQVIYLLINRHQQKQIKTAVWNEWLTDTGQCHLRTVQPTWQIITTTRLQSIQDARCPPYNSRVHTIQLKTCHEHIIRHKSRPVLWRPRQ